MNARAFSNRLAELLSKEQHAMADFLVALAEFDEKRLWEELGYRGLFYFLHKELGLSKGAAYYRQVGARLARRHAEVVEALREGRLCITSLVEVSKVLTPENCAEVLPRFFHRSRRDAKIVAAELKPMAAPPMREVLTQVPRQSVASLAPSPAPSLGLVQPAEPTQKSFQPTVTTRFDRLSEVEPLTAQLRRLHVTVTVSFLEKLERARDGMSSARPDATTAEVLEAGLDLVLARQAKLRGETSRPQKKRRRSEDPAHIPAWVKREVWARDKGCCQWPTDAIGICASTRQLQYDHKLPRAMGGLPTVENTRLLCLFHNQLAARLAFGEAWMERWRRRPAVAREPEASYGALRPRPRVGRTTHESWTR